MVINEVQRASSQLCNALSATAKATSEHDRQMPRVLMLAFAFPPMAVAGTFRSLRFARYLRFYGWDPLVLTVDLESLPEIPVDRNLNEWVPPEVVVLRAPVFRPISSATEKVRFILKRLLPQSATVSTQANHAVEAQSSSTLLRSLRNIKKAIKFPSFAPDRHISWTIPAIRTVLRAVRTHRPDVLYSSGPPHSSHLIGVLAKKITGLPLIIDLRDPWANSDWQSDNGRITKAIQRWLERICVHSANAVILNTESVRNQFCRNYPEALHHKFVTITNGYDPELKTHIESLLENAAANDTQRVAGEFRLCHAGSVYGERKLQPLVAAIAELNRTGYRVVLEQIGPISAEEELRAFIHAHDADDYIKFLGNQPHEVALHHSANANILVVLQPGTATQIPGKLFEILLFQKPILALADAGETSELILRYKLGTSLSSEDHTSLVREIKRLVAQGANCFQDEARSKALHDFDGCLLTGKLAEVFNRFAPSH